MKKAKRIGAIIAIVLLLSLYGVTFYAGLTASPDSKGLLMASLYTTFMVPLLLYVYMLVYKLLKKRGEEEAKKRNGKQ
ncbi:hypothetical protein [Anaerocolumna xylanovorans]|uniref:Uncharacterized protein n=1 Tax=Anaerocolumna xylanovorans DSM 12503 TaxID=1121345 RepID=A0A1M7YHA6_9FIRM|nr:hypothetical protein [Anaerocolumna xylanovorans]SHO51898.1 hypothetical protein SAMN02745217_03396 [Anaerocolumna xylanovorans DSM 12503]